MSVYKDKKRGTYYVSFSQKDISTGKFKHITKRGFLAQKFPGWKILKKSL